jgi:hypothetical protein
MAGADFFQLPYMENFLFGITIFQFLGAHQIALGANFGQPSGSKGVFININSWSFLFIFFLASI